MKRKKIIFLFFVLIFVVNLEALMPNDSYNLNLSVSNYLKMQSVFDSVSAKIESKKFTEAEEISKRYEQQFPEMALGFFLEFYVGVESKNLSLIEKSLTQLSGKYFSVNYYYSYFQEISRDIDDKEFQLELTRLVNGFCDKRIEFLETKAKKKVNLKKIYKELSYLYFLKNNQERVYENLQKLINSDYQFVREFQTRHFKNNQKIKELVADYEKNMRVWNGTSAQKITGLFKLSSSIKSYCATLPFSSIPDWDLYVESFIPRILKARTKKDYYEILAKIVGKIGDNHTAIRFPDDIENSYAKCGLEIVYLQGKYVVSSIESEELKKIVSPGDEIVKIDDIPVKLFIDAEKDNFPFVKYYYSEPEIAAKTMLANHLLDGKKKTKIKVELKKANQNKYTVSLRRNYSKKNIDNRESIIMKALPDSIYYFEIKKFWGADIYREFLSKIKNIHPAEVKGIIFDIRENRGGNSGFGDKIFSHLINKPVKNYIYNFSPVFFPFDEVRAGIGCLSSDVSGKEILPADSLIFNCPVAVLISPKTSSAAEDFAFLFKYYKRGKLIGLPTSGGTGNPLNVLLPGGGSLRICLNTDLYFFKTGIQPDVFLDKTIADLVKNRDSQLEKALELIKKERK